MRSLNVFILLLAGAVILNSEAGRAQNAVRSNSSGFGLHSVDLALTYTPERARVVNQNCSCFWLQGISGDTSLNVFHGLGLAANITYGTANNVQPGVNLSKVTFTAGPRYTWNINILARGKKQGNPSRLYAQGLFGVAHGFNSLFPAASGAVSSANSSAIQFGGGFDLALTKRFALRVADVEWVRTALPNTASNVQNDLRLGIGASFHFVPKEKR